MQISKRILFTLFLIVIAASTGIAQDAARAQVVREMMWNKSEPEYQNTMVPDKWKNESAVILYQDYNHYFTGEGKHIEAHNSYHIKIALLDKAAVKEYSKFIFTEKFYENIRMRYLYNGVIYTGFKVIKATGKEEIVNLNEAVEVGSDKDDNTKKIAIPNLQVGDILDYYYFEEEKITVKTYMYDFSPVVSTLATTYPIVYLKRQFHIQNNFFFNCKPVNGAPKLEQKVQGDVYIYKLETTDIDKLIDLEWMCPSRSLPTIKFQVYYSKVLRESYLVFFHGQAGLVNTIVNNSEVAKYIRMTLSQDYSFDQRDFKKQLKKRGLILKDLSQGEVAKEIYFYLYNKHIGRNLETYLIEEDNHILIHDYAWIGVMDAALNENNVKADLLIIPDKRDTDFKDLLLSSELKFLIKVEDADEDIYFSNFSLHPTVNELPAYVQNVKAFQTVLSPSQASRIDPTKVPSLRIFRLPNEDKSKNNVNIVSEVNISTDMNSLVINNDYVTKGQSRDYYQSKLLTLDEYIYDEYKLYATRSLQETTHIKELKPIVAQDIIDLKSRQAKECKENLETILKNEYDASEVGIESYQVTSIGRRDNLLFSYTAKFIIHDLIKQAGSNYLLNIGMLITKQQEVKEKDRGNRKVDIYAPYPRSYDSTINLTIPDGYTIEGVEKLNVDIQNETGGFITSSKLNGNQLTITYKKWYANSFEPKENWNKMLDFLDAAAAFNDINILLKKS